MNPKILEEKPISLYDLKDEIKKIQKRDPQLSIRTGKSEEYINQFSTLKEKEVEAIEKDISDMNIPRMKDLHIKKIIDTLPTSVEELKVIMQGYAITMTKENMQKIISIMEKHSQHKPEHKS
jgi:DNA-directed RNA polymerase subunit F